MDKPFCTYVELVQKLRDKKLKIVTEDDEKHVISLLKKYSYFALVSGYKTPFKKNKTDEYISNTTIDDILALYVFDNNLRQLFFKYIMSVENNIKSLLSYSFSEQYGELQSAYLSTNNYNYTMKYQQSINKLIQILTEVVDPQKTQYEYIKYQIKAHQNVPLWVAIKAVSIGKVSKMYSMLKPNIQTKISKEFKGINEKDLKDMLALLSRYRNVCAHNERLYDYRSNKCQLPHLLVHDILKIPEIKPGHLKTGQNNLLAVIITLKYLLDNDEFIMFFNEFKTLLNDFKTKTNILQIEKLRKLMGLNPNWEEIKEVKI